MQTQRSSLPSSAAPIRRPSGYVWATLLIALGAVLLLNNLGLLPWSIWATLARLWPVVLIALGAELLLGRSQPLVGGAVAALLILLVVGISVAFFLAPGRAGPFGVLPPATHREEIAVPLQGSQRGEVALHGGVARLDLRAAPGSSTDLVRVVATLPADRQIEQTSSASGGVARATLSERAGPSTTFPFDRADQSGNLAWDVRLAPRIPLTLEASLGVGQSTLDLGELNVENLAVTTGVGETTIMLPANAGHTQATIRGGVGHLTLIVPPDVGARLQAGGGIGSVNASPRFRRDGNVYQTENYGSAAHGLDLDLHLGIGSVDVR
jgi:hypothetical protein